MCVWIIGWLTFIGFQTQSWTECTNSQWWSLFCILLTNLGYMWSVRWALNIIKHVCWNCALVSVHWYVIVLPDQTYGAGMSRVVADNELLQKHTFRLGRALMAKYLAAIHTHAVVGTCQTFSHLTPAKLQVCVWNNQNSSVHLFCYTHWLGFNPKFLSV